MSQLASFLFLIFLLKMTCVGLFAVCIRNKFSTYLESLLASWCGVQTLIYGQLLLLSAFSMLTTSSIWICTIGMTVVISLIMHYTHGRQQYAIFQRKDYAVFFTKQPLIPLSGIIIVFVYYCWHSFYFYDTSADAFSYGLTRIQFYAHYHTLFVHQPTISLNIFSNEWNGELSALYYVLAVSDLQAATFANAEIWLLLSLSFCYVAELFGVPARYRVLFGFAFASAPVFLGLAMLVKGDLLSIAAFLIGIGFVLRFLISKDDPFLFAAAVVALSISDGAKISLLISVVLFITVIFWQFVLSTHVSIRARIISCLLALFAILIDNSRYVINLFVYHNPFKHIEETEFSLRNIFSNLTHIISSTVDLLHAKLPFPDFFLVISPGFLWLLPIIVGSLVMIFFNMFKEKSFQPLRVNIFKKLTTRQQVFLASAFFIGFIVFSASGEWRVYSYRYYASWVTFLLVILTVISSKYWRKINITLFFSIWIFFAVWNYLTAFVPYGEQLSVPYYALIQKSGQERMMINIPHYGEEIGKFADSVPADANILVLNGYGKIVSPFFGTHYRNNIYLAGKLEGPHYDLDKTLGILVEAIKKQPDKYAYIVLSGALGSVYASDAALTATLARYHYNEILVNRDIPKQHVYVFQKTKAIS